MRTINLIPKMKTPSKDSGVTLRKPILEANIPMKSVRDEAKENGRLLNEQKMINEQLELDLVHKKEEVLKLTSELNDLRTQGTQSIPPYAQNKSFAREFPIPTGECELEFYKKEVLKQDKKIKNLRDFEYKFILLKKKLASKQNKIDELQTQLRYKNSKADLSTVTNCKESHNNFGSYAQYREIQQKNQEIEQFKIKVDEAAKTIQSLKDDLEAKNAQVMNLLEMIEDAEQRDFRASKLKDKKIEKLQEQLFRAERNDQLRNNTTYNDWRRRQSGRNTTREDEIQAVKESNAQLRKQLALSNENAKEKVEELETQLKEKSMEIEQLREKTQVLKTPDVSAILKATLDAVLADSRAQMKDMESRYKMEMKHLEEKNRKEFEKIQKEMEKLKISSKPAPVEEDGDWRRSKSRVPTIPYVRPHLRNQKVPQVRDLKEEESKVDEILQKFDDGDFDNLESDLDKFMKDLTAKSTKLAEVARPKPSKVDEPESEDSEDSDSEFIDALRTPESSCSSFSDITFSSGESYEMARASPEW